MKSLVMTAALAVLCPAVASAQWLPAAATEADSISRSGNVGIGRSPFATHRLSVGGNTTGVNNSIFLHNGANSQFELGEASNNSTGVQLWNYMPGFIRFGTNNIYLMHLAPEGNVGIRTVTPSATLHVNGGGTPLRIDSANGMPVIFRDTLASDGYGSGILLDMSAGNSVIRVSGLTVGSFGMPRINSASAPLVFNAESPHDVEIGTTTNKRTLVVHGDVDVRGNIAAKFQDLAEWVPTIADLPAGTVVVLDTARSNHVLASARAYDTAVAGVVSPQPGIMLGEAGDSKALVATTGRVRVRVDATRAPIAIGDLLVTSDRAGMAMKSVPAELQGLVLHRPGTVLGKALEPLTSGTGEILVLLSLQ
jgi:hypothetical protein